MMFVVQFIGELDETQEQGVVRTTTFEADDIHSVITRMHFILSTRGYEPNVYAFQIVTNGKDVIYRAQRETV